MDTIKHLTTAELEAGLDEVRRAPTNEGVLELIVRRPQTEERDILTEGELDLTEGLVGDNWKARGSGMTPDGSAHPEMQLNIMNSRATALVAQSKDRWHLAGDQLYIDMDLSAENLPAGDTTGFGFGNHRSHPGSPYWVQKVYGPLWGGRHEIRQLARRQAVESARHLRQSRPARNDSSGRPCQKNISLPSSTTEHTEGTESSPG